MATPPAFEIRRNELLSTLSAAPQPRRLPNTTLQARIESSLRFTAELGDASLPLDDTVGLQPASGAQGRSSLQPLANSSELAPHANHPQQVSQYYRRVLAESRAQLQACTFSRDSLLKPRPTL